jgi:hypothetical protein
MAGAQASAPRLSVEGLRQGFPAESSAGALLQQGLPQRGKKMECLEVPEKQ